MNYYLLI